MIYHVSHLEKQCIIKYLGIVPTTWGDDPEPHTAQHMAVQHSFLHPTQTVRAAALGLGNLPGLNGSGCRMVAASNSSKNAQTGDLPEEYFTSISFHYHVITTIE